MSTLSKTSSKTSRIEKTSNIIISANLFAFLLLSVSFHGSYKVSIIAMVCSYFLFLIPTIRNKISLTNDHKIFTIGYAVYTSSIILELVLHGENLRELDPASKTLLCMPFLLLLSTVNLKRSLIPVSFSIGAIILFAVAYYERSILGSSRASAGINPIQFGNIASAMGVICLFLIKGQTNKCGFIIPLLIIGGITGLSASFLSLSRGGWLIIPVAFILLGFQYRHSLKSSPTKFLYSAIVILFTIALMISETNITSRLQTSISNVNKVSHDGNTTSIGLRFEMWKVAYDVFTSAPIVGVGKSAYLAYQQAESKRENISSKLKEFNQAHNAYLDAAARRGIIGLTGLLVFLLLPLIIAWKYVNSKNSSIQAYAYSLVILSLSFLSYNLTQSMFNHNSGIIMFTMFMIILMSGLNTEKINYDLNNNYHKKRSP